MNKTEKLRKYVQKVIYTGLAFVLICLVIVSMIAYMYSYAEGEAFERLHLETQQIKNDINKQIVSDMENLVTMANFAATLYENGDSYEFLLDSFEEIGLFENIGILMPDNMFMAKNGVVDLSGTISFKEEAKRGQYVSGRVPDLIDSTREVVRSAAPVKSSDGTIRAIIYGVINMRKFREVYEEEVEKIDSYLYVVEGGNGNYIIDTRNDSLGSINVLSSSTFKEGFSYSKLVKDMTEGKSGYASFLSRTGEGFMYAHYAPLNIADWQIMVSQPGSIVFSRVKSTVKSLALISCIIILIMFAYIIMILSSESKEKKISLYASEIRKKLLEMNQQIDKTYDVLKSITEFARARSTFIIDTNNDEYYYIVPSLQDKLLSEEERKCFNQMLLRYVAKHRTEHGATLYMSEINSKSHLRERMPDAYDFFEAHDIKRVTFAVVVNNNSNTYLLGVLNSQKGYVRELLREIAICFSMAIFNKKHLTKTEKLALTDSLTGMANRMAYKQYVKEINQNTQELLGCVYVDVNELHYYNDKYGHAAGDQMLVFVGQSLKKEFSESKIYRMGGDEFLIFVTGITFEEVTQKLARANEKIEEMKYHVSVGVKYREEGMSIEELVNVAERLMYVEKAKYYQNKGSNQTIKLAKKKVEKIHTGIKEIDACISVMSRKYLAIFCVSHSNDNIVHIVSQSYFSEMFKETGSFVESMRKYIHEIVRPEYHRTLSSFLEYDSVNRQLNDGYVPKTTYTKINDEKVTLSIHSVSGENYEGIDSIWIFERED